MTTGATTETPSQPGQPSRLALLERGVAIWCAELDPQVLSGPDAADGAQRLGVMIRRLTAAQTALAGRVDETRAFRQGRNGHQDAAGWLANTAGISLGEANKMMRTGERLKDCPVAKDAFEAGELSLTEAEVVARAAKADPSSEGELVDLARRKHHVGGLKEKADKICRAAHDRKSAEERSARARATRRWRMFADPEDGTPRADAKFTPEGFAQIKPVLDLFQEEIFNAARRAGLHDPTEAYAHDALVAAVTAAGEAIGYAAPAPTDEPVATDGDAGPLDAESTDSSESNPAAEPEADPARAALRALLDGARTLQPRLVLLADAIALQRGWAAAGETCEIPGVGPVDVAWARQLLGEAAFDVVVHNSVDVLSVASTTRYTPRPLKVAVTIRDRRCVVRGCTRARRVERDHGDDYAQTHDTSYANLHLLCEVHHDEKTHRGARLERHGDEWWWYPPPPTTTSDPDGHPPPTEPWRSPVGEQLNRWNLDHLPGDDADEDDDGDPPTFDFGPAA